MEINCTEKEILTRFIQGDEAMFGLLYERYHHAIYLNVIKLLHHTADAEDIVQEVFITLWNKRSSIDTEKCLKGWLFTVSYHLAIDFLKKKIKQPVSIQNEETVIKDSSDIEFPELQWGLLEDAINSLSPQKKRAFQLCKLEGKTYEQAANEMGISKYTVNEYLKEGIFFIRKYVKEKTALSF